MEAVAMAKGLEEKIFYSQGEQAVLRQGERDACCPLAQPEIKVANFVLSFRLAAFRANPVRRMG